MNCFLYYVLGLIPILIVFCAHDSGNNNIISFNLKINHKKKMK